jgi:ubiquinone/menaquinone biosynthesis C-methylase UbiE
MVEYNAMNNWRGRFLNEVCGRALEIGAGEGSNLDHYPPGVELIATEFDAGSIGLARPKASAHIRLASADIEHLAFPDATFDAVVATLVFCSVEQPLVGLNEVRRVLKPDGRLYLLEHVRSQRRWLGRLQDRLAPWWFRWTEGCNLNRDTEANVRAAGFEIEALHVRWLGVIKTIVAQKLIN